MSPTCHNITECDIDTGPHLSLCHKVWHCVTVTQILTMVPRVVSHSSGRLMASLMLVPSSSCVTSATSDKTILECACRKVLQDGKGNICFWTDQNVETWSWSKIMYPNYPTANWLIEETNWDAMTEDGGDCLDDLTNCCPLSAPWERIHSFQSLPSFQFPVARNKQTAALQPICFVPRPSAHVMKYQSPQNLNIFQPFLGELVQI